MTLTAHLILSPASHDSDQVYWVSTSGEKLGAGFRSKKTGQIHVIRCPKCLIENYIAQVMCVCCGFYPTKLRELEETQSIFAEQDIVDEQLEKRIKEAQGTHED